MNKEYIKPGSCLDHYYELQGSKSLYKLVEVSYTPLQKNSFIYLTPCLLDDENAAFYTSFDHLTTLGATIIWRKPEQKFTSKINQISMYFRAKRALLLVVAEAKGTKRDPRKEWSIREEAMLSYRSWEIGNIVKFST
jgi:hypothetical protein